MLNRVGFLQTLRLVGFVFIIAIGKNDIISVISVYCFPLLLNYFISESGEICRINLHVNNGVVRECAESWISSLFSL